MAACTSQAGQGTQMIIDSTEKGTLRHYSDGAAKGSLAELLHVNTIQHYSAALHKSSSCSRTNLLPSLCICTMPGRGELTPI